MKAIIMCAGCCSRYSKEYPKHLEPICGEINYNRTIRLLNENGINDVFISVSAENTKHFNYPNKILGSNKREIDRYRNLRLHMNGNTLILFGDVVYHPDDMKLILSSLDKDILPFGRKERNDLTNKNYGEIMGVFVRNHVQFINSFEGLLL